MRNKNLEKKKPNIFVRWWRLSEPHKGYLAGQIFFQGVYAVFVSVLTIFAARTINCMYAGDWNGAFFNLAIELSTILIRNISSHIQYRFYVEQEGHVWNVIGKKIYNKFLTCKQTDINSMSKEKITNIALNNISAASNFPDVIALFVAALMQVIFTLVIVFRANWLAGVLVVGLGIINFFAYTIFNRKLGKIMLERYEKKDDMFKSYSKIIDGKEVINELNAKKEYEGQLMADIDKNNRAFTKYYMLHSSKVNLYYGFWNVIVYAISALMIYYVSRGSLGIEIYLVIVPYLTSCTAKLNELFDKSSSLENMRVDVDRVNLILNLDDEELVKYGDVNNGAGEYNLALINVTEYEKPDQKYTLKKANISFASGKINVIKGPKEGGKRVVFDLLRRHYVPDKGKVLLDNLNLYDYNESTFKTHINYCASHPVFIRGTIRENLSLVDKNLENIKSICLRLGVLDDIEALPSGFDTEIVNIDSPMILFSLGLVRAMLSNCKILMIYELPQNVPESFRHKIIKLITEFDTSKTIILFTHTNAYDEIAEVVYQIEEGKTTKVK